MEMWEFWDERTRITFRHSDRKRRTQTQSHASNNLGNGLAQTHRMSLERETGPEPATSSLGKEH
jgi:hypothetical protein